jgi:hypothetical protein
VGALTDPSVRRYEQSRMDNAVLWEIQNGAALTGNPKFGYKSYVEAPSHHKDIARLWVAGRKIEQIAQLYMGVYKNPVKTIKIVLRHPPIMQHIAQELELVRQAREEKMQERVEAGELGFDTMRDMVANEKIPAKVRADLAKWLAENDPLDRFTEKFDSQKDEVHDTDSLNEFFEHHEFLKQREGQTVDVDATSCDTSANKEIEHAEEIKAVDDRGSEPGDTPGSWVQRDFH